VGVKFPLGECPIDSAVRFRIANLAAVKSTVKFCRCSSKSKLTGLRRVTVPVIRKVTTVMFLSSTGRRTIRPLLDWGRVLPYFWKKMGLKRCLRGVLPASAGLFLFLCVTLLSVTPGLAGGQSSDEKAVPILTGSAGYFNFVTAGQNEVNAQINPVLLVPLGDRWLVESRAEFEGAFQRPPDGGSYGGMVSKNLDYLQADYIANPYLTVTLGRFLTPFGIFNERLYPIWIRSLQQDPLILPLSAESSDGMMLRGGFPVNAKVNLNYAAYVSAVSSGHSNLESDRNVGGRVGIFLPGPRVEVGASWQKLLQDERTHSFGFHFAWQPTRLPLNIHSEYARSNHGSGYWIDGAYRLSQVLFWQKALRRLEFAGRAEQFFSGQISSDEAEALELPAANTREGEFGLNYYLHDGLKAVASYGRQFSSAGNLNLWTVGIASRFAVALGRAGSQ
jgi:hypothetical protein